MSAPEDTLERFAPQPADSHLTRGTVRVRHVEVLLLESYPVQVHLLLQGALPSPCHQLRIVAQEADAENRVLIEAYSVTNPKKDDVRSGHPRIRGGNPAGELHRRALRHLDQLDQ